MSTNPMSFTRHRAKSYMTTQNVPRLVKPPISVGRVPSNLFSAIHSVVKSVSPEMDAGTVPVIKLEEILSDSSDGPKLSNGFPCNRFRSTSSSLKFSGISAGSDSSILLSDRSNTCNPVNALISSGMTPTRLLFSGQNQNNQY